MSCVLRSICWIIFPNGTKLDAHKFGTSRGPNSDQRYTFTPFATFRRP